MHVDRLGGLAGMTLTALGLVTGHRPGGDDPACRAPTAAAAAAGLVTVRPTMPAIEAFEVMCRLSVSGVGQDLALVHFSPQPDPVLLLKPPNTSNKKCLR